MNICLLTCPIVKDAIEKNKKLGIEIGKSIDYSKEHCAYCLMCSRNEKSDWPDHLKIDNSKGGDTE